MRETKHMSQIEIIMTLCISRDKCNNMLIQILQKHCEGTDNIKSSSENTSFKSVTL